MTASPLVSIVIDNFNYARFLGEAIESALSQTYERCEVVVVDDGSSDGSREVIERFASRVHAVYKANGGQASAFNAALRAAKGDVVCFLDSDDVFAKDKVARVVDAFASRPRAALVYHRVLPVDAERRPVADPWPAPLYDGAIDRVASRSGGWWHYPPTSALSFRVSRLASILPIPETQFRICADAYLADAAPFLGDVVGLAEVLAEYRHHGTNQWAPSTADRAAPLRTALARYETRVQGLNGVLAQLGRAERVSLEDHWPYHRLRQLSGEQVAPLSLARLALTFPAEPRRLTRLRSGVGALVRALTRSHASRPGK